MKPDTLCKLEKGKFIGGQENFVDTFNWMVDFCNNLRASDTPYHVYSGDYIKVKLDDNDSEHPTLKIDRADNSSLSSFEGSSSGGGSIIIDAIGQNGQTTTATLSSGCHLIFQAGLNSNVTYTCSSDVSGNVYLMADVGWFTPS